MAKIHEAYLQKYLDQNRGKSYIGSDLVETLKGHFPGLTNTNSKKIIRQAAEKGMISSSKPIKFANNQYAYFSSNSQLGYKVLENSIKEYKKPLHRVVFALKRNKDVLRKFDACKIAGTTNKREAHSVSFDTVIEDLMTLKLAHVESFYGTEFIVMKKQRPVDDLLDKILEEQKSNSLILNLSMQWMVHSNIVDQRDLCYTGEKNSFNGVNKNDEVWDGFGFSNAVGIGSKTREFQTLVLVDFLPSYRYEEYDFEGFRQRIERTIHSTKKERRKVLPVIFAKDVSPRAHYLMKKNGYLYFHLPSLFGDALYEIARKFIRNDKIITEKIENKNPDINDEVLDSLNSIRNSGNEVNYGNLKGHLFEYLMYPLVNEIYSKSLITHGYSGKYDGKEFECDYLVEKKQEIVVIELKGYKKDTYILKGEKDSITNEPTKNSILWFLNRTFYLCSQFLQTGKKMKFSYITTADFEEPAKEMMRNRKSNKPSDLELFYNHDSLIDLLEEHGMKKEIEIIEQFYS